MKTIVLLFIRFYQKYLSPDTGWARAIFITDQTCRFQPTCSHYAYEAVKKYGSLKGLFLGFLRIIRCHPLSKGGLDPLR